MFWIILALVWFVFWIACPISMAIKTRDNDFYALIPISFFVLIIVLIISLLLWTNCVKTNDLDNAYNKIIYQERLIKTLNFKTNYNLQEITDKSDVTLIEIENYKDLIDNYNYLVNKIGDNNKYKNNIFYIHISKGEKYNKYKYYDFNWEKLR